MDFLLSGSRKIKSKQYVTLTLQAYNSGDGVTNTSGNRTETTNISPVNPEKTEVILWNVIRVNGAYSGVWGEQSGQRLSYIDITDTNEVTIAGFVNATYNSGNASTSSITVEAEIREYE